MEPFFNVTIANNYNEKMANNLFMFNDIWQEIVNSHVSTVNRVFKCGIVSSWRTLDLVTDHSIGGWILFKLALKARCQYTTSLTGKPNGA